MLVQFRSKGAYAKLMLFRRFLLPFQRNLAMSHQRRCYSEGFVGKLDSRSESVTTRNSAGLMEQQPAQTESISPIGGQLNIPLA